MKAFKITDVKDFMNKLLLGEIFDSFAVNEATITTFCTFSLDGLLRPDFFDTDAQSAMKENKIQHATWKELRSFCYSIIRGKRTPLSFRIIFQLPHSRIQQILTNSHLNFTADAVNGMYLNISYKNNELICTTGTSFNTFIPDKSLEHLWDTMIPNFFRKHGIIFEEL